jgi:hypothetical protein
MMRRLAGILLLTTASLSSLTGCSFIKGITNPDVAWAMGESSPMSVVVRRNELATGIADEVDRLMTDTPVDQAAEDAFALTKADMEKRMNEAAVEPIYGGQPFKVVPAEAWLPTLASTCAEEAGHDTLVGMLEGDVEDRLTAVNAQSKAIAKLEAKVSAAEERRDADGTSDGERATLDASITKLEGEIDELEAAYDPKVRELITAVREAGHAVPAKAKERMTPIVMNLLEAVEDARIANDAAIVRYPMAVPGLTSDLQSAATRFVADVIEEQSGHRPSTQGIAPEITLEGTDVKLGLNGVPAEVLGDLDMGEVIVEVTERTQAYAGRAFTLLADADETADRLELQADILNAWRDGLAAPELAEGVVDITDIEVVAKAAAPKSAGDEPAPKTRTLGGLSVQRCATTGPAVAARDPSPAKPGKGKSKPGKSRPRKGPKHTASSKPAPGQTKWIDLPAGGEGPMMEAP